MAFSKQKLNRFQKLWQRRENSRGIKRKLSKRQSNFVLEPLEPRILLSVNLWAGDIRDGTVWQAGDIQRLTADVHVQQVVIPPPHLTFMR